MNDIKNEKLANQGSKKEKSAELDEELDDTFPASDPPSVVQPGSGVTGAPPKQHKH